MNIFIAKLDFEIQDQDLMEAFSPFGEVVSAKVVIDKYSNRSRGFGFVEMKNEADGLKAINELNDSEMHGRTVVVKKAEPRKERSNNNDRW